MKSQIINRIGEARFNGHGDVMTIVRYINSSHVTVKFQDGNLVDAQYSNFKSGNIRNKLTNLVYGYGKNNGEHVYDITGKILPSYKTWTHMLERSYSKKYHIRKPTYIGCTVAPVWLNYTNFKQWYDINFYSIAGQVMCLDKDILVPGNKVYGPETCIFVTNKMNTQKLGSKSYMERIKRMQSIAEIYYGLIPREIYNMMMNVKVQVA